MPIQTPGGNQVSAPSPPDWVRTAYSESFPTDERETIEHSHDRLRGFFSYAFRLHEETCESSFPNDVQHNCSLVFTSDPHRAARHFDHLALVHLASHAGRTRPPAQEVRDCRGYSFGRQGGSQAENRAVMKVQGEYSTRTSPQKRLEIIESAGL